MRIDDLFEVGFDCAVEGPEETNAFTDVGALQEAQLLAWKVDGVRSRAILLFDCRGALRIRGGNTGVLLLQGVRELQWNASRVMPRAAWMVVGWHPAVTGTDWRLLVGFEPDATLRLVAASGRFFVGDVPGCDVAPPDFVADDDATLAAGLAGWDSEISLSYCSPIRP